MAYVFLVLGLALAFVLWDLGRRRFKQSEQESRIDKLERQFDAQLSSVESALTTEVKQLDQRVINVERAANGRAPTTRLTPFGQRK